MTLPPSDDDLVIASQRGQSAAFEELMRRLARPIYARIYASVRDAHRAEDLTQETFLTAWRSLPKLDRPAAFRPWLYTIAHTTTLDAAKRDSRQKRAPAMVNGKWKMENPLDAIPSPAPSPPEAAALAEERSHLLDTLQTLPENYREVLLLRYLLGSDYHTIARQLAISNGSLRGLLARALQTLREKLAGREGSSSW